MIKGLKSKSSIIRNAIAINSLFIALLAMFYYGDADINYANALVAGSILGTIVIMADILLILMWRETVKHLEYMKSELDFTAEEAQERLERHIDASDLNQNLKQ